MRFPIRLQALSHLAIVRLSLIFAVMWAALACAALFGLVRARLDVGRTAAVEAHLSVTAISAAIAQAPGLYGPSLQKIVEATGPTARQAILAVRGGAADSRLHIEA